MKKDTIANNWKYTEERVAELLALPHDWFGDLKVRRISQKTGDNTLKFLKWLSESFTEIPCPCIFPTVEGTINLEWSRIGDTSYEAEISETQINIFGLNMKTDKSFDYVLPFFVV